MSTPREGWFPDPTKTGRMRWWSGTEWTEHVSAGGRVWQDAVTANSKSIWSRWWLWLLLLLGLILLFTAPQLIAAMALIALITAIVALVKQRPTWLRLPTRKAATSVLAASAIVLVVAAGVNAASLGGDDSRDGLFANLAAVDEQSSTEATPQASPRPSRTQTPTPTPSPTPQVTVVEEVTTETVDFDRLMKDDPNLASGKTSVTTEGVPGTRTLTYRVTYEEDREISRELISDVITAEPVAEVVARGTYVAPPPPPPPPPANNGCDPNYADACVPIASDVDCAWGSGDGPAYFDGVARVVGRDIYGLDRDGDGWACER